MNKISIIGSGAWASALAFVLAENKCNVTLYTRHKEIEEEINISHTNKKYLGDLKLNEKIKASTSLEILNDSDYIIICIPSKNINDLNEYKKYIISNPLIINATKGIDYNTGLGIHYTEEKILSDIKHKGIVSLIGPTFASEVIRKQYTCITSVSENKKNNKIVQELFSNSFFRVYTNTDLIGCEISAGMKNIIAIASGISQGLGYENNTQAALITRGLNEIIRYGLYHKAKLKTFFSLACIGDLYMTCSSFESRNFKAGYLIGKDDSAKDFLKNNKITVEGIEACKIIVNNIKGKNISLPITESIYKIIFEDYKPSFIINELMKRDLKEE